MSKKENRVNISLLKDTIMELEKSLENAYSLENDPNKYFIELSKCVGLCTGASQEAAALISDIVNVLKASQTPKEDSLTGLLSGIKMPGGLPGAN